MLSRRDKPRGKNNFDPRSTASKTNTGLLKEHTMSQKWTTRNVLNYASSCCLTFPLFDTFLSSWHPPVLFTFGSYVISPALGITHCRWVPTCFYPKEREMVVYIPWFCVQGSRYRCQRFSACFLGEIAPQRGEKEKREGVQNFQTNHTEPLTSLLPRPMSVRMQWTPKFISRALMEGKLCIRAGSSTAPM